MPPVFSCAPAGTREPPVRWFGGPRQCATLCSGPVPRRGDLGGLALVLTAPAARETLPA